MELTAIRSALLPILVYPGALWVLALVLLVGAATGSLRATVRGAFFLARPGASFAWQVGALATLGAVALLPWPTAGGRRFDIWPVWALIEASQLLAALPGLRSSDPETCRRAAQEAQLCAAGRWTMWPTAWVAVVSGTQGRLAIHGLAVAAMLLALPVALGWPPFGSGQRLEWTGSLGRQARGAAVTMATLGTTALLGLFAAVTVNVTVLHPAIMAGAAAGGLVALSAVGQGLRGLIPEQRLRWSLRWWQVFVVPPAVLAVLALLLPGAIG
ncbi:MAG: hypothetical protein NVSMB42_03070 [Herpetosiphon sp.]